MGLKCGIVGLPNVGKSTLFNAVTQTAEAQAANYPFCTIDPNIGRVNVPDQRLDTLASLAQSQKIIPNYIEFVDIAGLVKGASKGEGLGNKFLANIREVDAIIHVLRCFEDPDITHVEGSIDPVRDAHIIETELMIADMESLEKRLPGIEKKIKSGDKDLQATCDIIKRALILLNDGQAVRGLIKELDIDEQKILMQLQLLTSKPVLYLCNVPEDQVNTGNDFTQKVRNFAADQGAEMVIFSAAIEAELIGLSDEEKQEFLESLGLKEPGLNRVIQSAYHLLNLITFFTIGPKEARAWTLQTGLKAPQAAGEIHSDFEKGFICAETIAYRDYVTYKSEQAVKEAGKMRQEGRDYIVKDGDVFHFRFNV